jgi:hypothetical protein
VCYVIGQSAVYGLSLARWKIVREVWVPISNCSEHKMEEGSGTREPTENVLLLATYFVIPLLQDDCRYSFIQIEGRHAGRTL